jgi:hypothetical protein
MVAVPGISTRAVGLAVACGALMAAPAAAEGRDPVILYATTEGASGVHDALGQVTLRQAPVRPNARWPRSRLIAKESGKELSRLPTTRIVSRLRAAWRDPGTGSRVAIDEISPGHWSAAAAARLRTAMIRLGADRRRVTFYASPSMVEQVGRTDPRRPLSTKLATLVDAMSRGRATYLLTYRGNLQPFPAREMATHPTRWLPRWPARRGTLHLMLGPDGGIGQAALWNRVRASAAGRRLLGNGPAAYGLRTAAQGSAWAAQYRAHLAAPSRVPPGGDFPVAVGGGLTLTKVGRAAVRVRAAREGRVVVRMRLLPRGRMRAIRKLTAPHGAVTVPLPRDAKPGRYRVSAVLQGNGLVDRRAVTISLRRPQVALSYASRVFTLRVPRGVRAVLSVTRLPDGGRRALGRVVGPATRRVALPEGLPAGRYRALVSTSGAGGQRIVRTISVG